MANINKIRVRLDNVRLSFANIFEAKAAMGGDPRYSANFLISKQDSDNLTKLKETIKGVMKLQWPAEDIKIKEDKMCLKNGDDKTWEGYANTYYVSASNKLKVKVFDENNLDLTLNPGDKPQSGDYVNAIIEIWAQDNNYGKRINANLVGVQFVKKGERFGSKTNDDELFGPAKTAVKEEPENPFLGEEVKVVVRPKLEEAVKETSKLSFGGKTSFAKPATPPAETGKKDDIDELFE